VQVYSVPAAVPQLTIPTRVHPRSSGSVYLCNVAVQVGCRLSLGQATGSQSPELCSSALSTVSPMVCSQTNQRSECGCVVYPCPCFQIANRKSVDHNPSPFSCFDTVLRIHTDSFSLVPVPRLMLKVDRQELGIFSKDGKTILQSIPVAGCTFKLSETEVSQFFLPSPSMEHTNGSALAYTQDPLGRHDMVHVDSS
jgi:hypothetical protein